jgi:hypothetical protein
MQIFLDFYLFHLVQDKVSRVKVCKVLGCSLWRRLHFLLFTPVV